jgi:hypothetical protein
VLIGVRCTGFGNRAFVSATLENLETGKVVSEPPPARPQLLYCGEEGGCDLVPYLVHATGIAELDVDRDDLPARLTAKVETEGGPSASASREVVLSTADL